MLTAGTALLLVLIPSVHHQRPADDAIEITNVALDSEDAGIEAAARTLPDDWYLTAPTMGVGVYRATIELETVGEPWAVYLPSVSMDATVAVNGHRTGGRLSGRARNWNTPLLFPVPPVLLRAGANRIEVRVAGAPVGSGLLGRFYIGPYATLAAAHRARTFWKVGVVWAITIGLGILGLFILWLWVNRRQDTIYAWFAAVVLMWAAHNLNVLVVHIPVSNWLWDWTFRYSSLQWFAILGVIFINRYIQRPQPQLERAMALCGVALMLAFGLCPPAFAYEAARHVWSPLMLCGGIYATLRLSQARRHTPLAESGGLLISALAVVAFGLRDTLLTNSLWDREHGFYLHYAAPSLLVAFAWILVRRFVSALNVSEKLNTWLEQRVEEKGRELERTYSQLYALERDRVVTAERERIMRDMHDGVAGHLISTLALVERRGDGLDDVSESLHRALTDLRLMIDSLDSASSDLATLLGMLRERLAAPIRASGINVSWQVEALPTPRGFGQKQALHVARIVQEAIANVLKHAGAHQLTMKARCEGDHNDGRIEIQIVDDGRGLDEAVNEGRGLPNMRRRAREIGAGLSIDGCTPGTCITIRLPMQLSSAES